MTLTIPGPRRPRATLIAAGALAGALAIPAGYAAAQQAYAGMPDYQPPGTYSAPPAYEAQPLYPPPSYAPVDYAPPTVTYRTRTVYAPAPVYSTPPYRTELTIIAPDVHRRTVGRSDSGIPIEELTASRVVDIGDLDLSRQQDVDIMDYRVRTAAVEACRTLDRTYPQSLYPSYPSSDADRCVVRAINDGVAQEHEAVATAEANAYAAAAYRR